jgi:hypothetical protein
MIFSHAGIRIRLRNVIRVARYLLDVSQLISFLGMIRPIIAIEVRVFSVYSK